ncbi:outer membrane beta-barrel family protein [Flexithrix dorotheae]|uniref:outer membrane beta-barrel family protein n=1 Tax=Flexithrix dorotheae TaxID=70993 RepID=UPI0003615E3F|nr:outer membrane beta-barrel family protein [Flexithrix dorotheae]
MKLKRLLLFLSILNFFSLPALFAQEAKTIISGKIVTGAEQQPVEFATVMIADPIEKKPITGVTTSVDGSFNVTTTATEFYIEISFIGFETKTINDFEINDGKVALGTIDLAENATALNEIEIRAEKSKTEFKLDKRVFNVGKDLSSTGMSALEVLNNVPSVQVNIEGVISLRGSSGVQILINGKPSVLATDQGALGTITADMLESVEVITNPSAKYDAEGTSGIINIVMKKEEKKGINGSVTLNTGYPNNHSIGLSVNRRTEKFNLFSQLGYGHRTFPGINKTMNMDLMNNTTVESDGDSEKNETFYNVILGADYHLNKYNIFSLTGNFAYEFEKEYSNSNFNFLDASQTLISAWNRDEKTEATNPKYQYDFQYQKTFKNKKEHVLLFSAQGNFFGKEQSSIFDNTPISGTPNESVQQTRTDFVNATYTYKLDYTNPISDKFTLESGAQYVFSDVSNDYAVQDLEDGEWIENSDLTNIFDFDQRVLGIYSTLAYKNEEWGVKLGLRMENTEVETLLEQTDERNTKDYANLFPTIHTSYKFTEFISIQAGYSRRIFRPRMWDLNPFFNIRNNFNIRTGNPDLLPEFTDSYEITAINEFENISFNFGIYHRYTTDVIERITEFQDNVSITRPENIGTNRSTGLEFNTKYSPFESLTLNGDFNYNYFIRKGYNESTPFDFNASQWSAKLNMRWKLPAQFELELIGNYQSSYKTVQSVMADNYFGDLGLRKKLMKGKTIFNVSIKDIFATRRMESETDQTNFYLYNYHRRGRFITVGVSYGFGKGEAMEFSGQKRF